MKSKCTIKIMSREIKLGCICNQTAGFSSSNCIVKHLDGICGQETSNISKTQHHTLSAIPRIIMSEISCLCMTRSHRDLCLSLFLS